MLRQRLATWLLHVLARHCRDLALLKNVLRDVENAELLLEDRIRHVARDGKTVATKRGNLTSHVMNVDAPWRHLDIPTFSIPGMISAEEAQHYEYIGRQYQSVGEGRRTRAVARTVYRAYLERPPRCSGCQRQKTARVRRFHLAVLLDGCPSRFR
jgi:hypothetical protein